MSVKLRRKTNGDGSVSLYLDIYHGGSRRYEFLKELKLRKPSNPIDREANKRNLEIAKAIEIKRAQELSASDYAISTENGKKVLVVDWMRSYLLSYKKKDIRNMQGALKRFSDFLIDEGKQGLVFGHLTELIISDFQDYLRARSTGEGASSYFHRFKKMVKQAYRHKIINVNPAAEVKTVQGKPKKRDILTVPEIQTLANTEIQNPEIKKAFLFTCLTGCRWAEVKVMTWDAVNIAGKYVDVFQGKGGSIKRVSLNTTVIKLIGDPGKKSDLVFNLPSQDGANKTLKAWVKRAGIDKKITWHNGRHSFGTNLIFHGADLSTATNLLGHSGYKHTQRYVHAANELKETATEKLNINI